LYRVGKSLPILYGAGRLRLHIRVWFWAYYGGGKGSIFSNRVAGAKVKKGKRMFAIQLPNGAKYGKIRRK
jgi:hypothetical protein